MIGPRILFWASLVQLAYTYAGYPVLIGVLGRFRAKAWKKGDELPKVSLIIAAWNEAGIIGQKLENALGLDYPRDRLEIILASDGSDDGTAAIASTFESRGVRVLDLPHRGKTATLNDAVEHASGDILVFSDANVFFRPDALRKLVRHFADPRIGGVSGDVRLKPEGFELGEAQGIYYRYERFIQLCESKLGSIVGADGGMYAIRKKHFRKVPADLINDDFILSMEVVRQGARLVYDPEAIAEEESPDDPWSEFKRKTRVEQGNFQSLFRGYAVPTGKDPTALWAYLSHKVARWFGFIPMSALALSSLRLRRNGPLYAVVFGGQSLFYGLAIVGMVTGGRGGSLVKIPHYFLLENLAAARGFVRLFSRTRDWGKAQTAARSGRG